MAKEKMKKFFELRRRFFFKLTLDLLYLNILVDSPDMNWSLPATNEDFTKFINLIEKTYLMLKTEKEEKGNCTFEFEVEKFLLRSQKDNTIYGLDKACPNIDIKKEKSLMPLYNHCLELSLIYNVLSSTKQPFDSFAIILSADQHDLFTAITVYEVIGYWTAKMEEKRRNIKSARVKTNQRKEKKETIKTMLEEHEFRIDNKFLSEAIYKTDRGERTIKNLIKEILNEKGT